MEDIPKSQEDLIRIIGESQALSRREELRIQIQQLGGNLSKKEIASSIVIGIFNAYQSRNTQKTTGSFDPDSVPYNEMEILEYIEETGELPVSPYLEDMKEEAQKTPLLRQILERAETAEVDFREAARELSTSIQHNSSQDTSIQPSDIDSKRYHEQQALALGIQGLFSKLNPFTLGESLWHLGKALQCSWQETNLYLELTEEAIHESQEIIQGWTDAVHKSQALDEKIEQLISNQPSSVKESFEQDRNTFDAFGDD